MASDDLRLAYLAMSSSAFAGYVGTQSTLRVVFVNPRTRSTHKLPTHTEVW